MAEDDFVCRGEGGGWQRPILKILLCEVDKFHIFAGSGPWTTSKSRLFLSLLAVDGGEVWGGPSGLQTSQTIGGQCLLSDPERSVPGTVHRCGGNE